MTRSLDWAFDPPEHLAFTGRRLAGWALRRTGAWLALLGRRMAVPTRHVTDVGQERPLLEFHADASAPEGALFVNGHYIGRIDVSRL